MTLGAAEAVAVAVIVAAALGFGVLWIRRLFLHGWA